MLLGMPPSRVSRFAAAIFISVLALTACASEDPEGASASGSSASQSGEQSTGAATSPTSEDTAEDAVEVSVSVQDGEVDPPTQRVEVEQGQQMRLIVTSDVDDQIHVHGFDVEAELQAGQPATVEFVADQTGLFEVETHETELLLLQLEIR